MLILTKSVLSIMIGFLLSVFCASFMIPLLRKLKASQSLSIYLTDRHKSKQGTPTMGGIIFILPTLITLIILYLGKKIDISYNLCIVVFTFLGYFIIGFIDDYLIVVKHNNKGLSEKAKFLLQVIIAVIFFYLFMIAGNEPLLWIHSLHIKLDIGWYYGLFIYYY